MITFLPLPDFKATARVLDRARLGQQRREAKAILVTPHIPAARMWAGHSNALCHYGMAMCEEWMDRGYNDELWSDFHLASSGPLVLPPWMGSYRLHSSHRARLLCKDASYYRQFGWKELPSETYFWPHSATYDWRRIIGDHADGSDR